MVSLTHIAFPHIVFLLFALLTLECLPISNSATCHADDEAGLLAFKSAITADPSGKLETWIPGTNCCQWTWIECSNNRVIGLHIFMFRDESESYLSGTLSPSLSKLRYLQKFVLEDLKNISGNNLFSILFRLPNIKQVDISNTKLSGQIPPNIHTLTGLEDLRIEKTQFSGTIPTSISKLTQLVYLILGNNLLSGTIPREIGQLKNLVILSLAGNQLTGSIPEMFTSMTHLINLNISHNKLSGKIPSSLSYLDPFYLDLGHNALTGQIPSYFGKFQNLSTLVLSSNRLSGAVPKTFANLKTTSIRLDLSNNLLVDPFPQMSDKVIRSLDLSYNNFHLGDIPKWVTTSPIIYRLNLAKCGIKIKLDNWKPLRPDVYEKINLSDNEISGSPFNLLNSSVELTEFSIAGNRLQFNMESLNIPVVLESLDLSRNLVFGKLPKAISTLKRLNVSYNHLCGSIPATNFPASAFIGNDCLCGSPLSPCKK